MIKVVLTQNSAKQEAMAKYMKNQFPFAGISAPLRKSQSKEMLKESKTWPIQEVSSEVKRYYALESREYQYIAIDLLQQNIKRLSYEEFAPLFYLVTEKAWWDSVDSLRAVISRWCLVNPEKFDLVFQHFTTSENFWNRRVAINLQLGYKEKTQTNYLQAAIVQDIDTNEFFIQKAIGWSLRDYSKSNPAWVRKFILETPNLSSLAVREGTKYL